MAQLTAHIVYATFKALDPAEKEEFVQLIENERERYKNHKPVKQSIYDKLPSKYHPDNIEMLVAELMHS